MRLSDCALYALTEGGIAPSDRRPALTALRTEDRGSASPHFTSACPWCQHGPDAQATEAGGNLICKDVKLPSDCLQIAVWLCSGRGTKVDVALTDRPCIAVSIAPHRCAGCVLGAILRGQVLSCRYGRWRRTYTRMTSSQPQTWQLDRIAVWLHKSWVRDTALECHVCTECMHTCTCGLTVCTYMHHVSTQ